MAATDLAFTFSGVKCIFKEAGAGDLRFDTQSCRSSVIDVLILLNLTINVLIANYIFYFVRQLYTTRGIPPATSLDLTTKWESIVN